MIKNEIRSEFPILQKKIYLNSCSLGALSLRSKKYVNEFLDLWDNYGASAWYEKWIGTLNQVRFQIADILNADESEIAVGPSVSALFSTISSCLTYENNDSAVVTELDFPTSNYQWLAKKGLGLDTQVIKSDNQIDIKIDQYREAITKNTKIVSTSHVFFISGHTQDIKEINKISRENGSLCIIDGYQSAGQIPVDLKALDIDMYMTGGLKWLMSGPGIAFLYVKKDMINKYFPNNPGWFGAKNQFDFNPHEFEFANDAKRFETGTPSAASLYQAKAGLELFQEFGPDYIHSETKALTEELINMLEKAGFELMISPEKENRTAIVLIKLKSPDESTRAVKALAEKGIIVDHRKEFVRVSAYFYNTSEELEIFVKELKKVTNI